jgi:hypothetical protein
MAVRLNRSGFDHAKRLIGEGHAVLDARDDWSEHQPSAERQNEFIEQHGWNDYRRWFLGIDDAHGEETKGRYKFPYGDFEDVHRCAVISAESRAAQYGHRDVETAAAHLHGMLDAPK